MRLTLNLQPHSEVPQRDEDWPSLASILQYQSRVRERVMNLYRDFDSGKVTLTRKIARVLFMTLEHEAFHVEVCHNGPDALAYDSLAADARPCCTCFCNVLVLGRSLLVASCLPRGRYSRSPGTHNHSRRRRRSHSVLRI